MLGLVERMIGADRARSPEEAAYLAHLRRWFSAGEASAADPDAGLLTKLFRFVRGNPAASRPADGDEGFAARLATRVARTLRPGSPAASVSGPRWTYLTLFGALLQRVIEADGVVRDEERQALRRILGAVSLFEDAEIDYVLELIRSGAAEAADRQRLCAEFNRLSAMPERLSLLEALFAVARADGDLSAAEQDELRLIANYLWIETQEFVRIRRESAGDRPSDSEARG